MPCSLSFECFPPKTEEGLLQLKQTADALSVFRPDYFSVTYGAGGSTQEATLNAVLALQQQQQSVTPHISCVGMTRVHILNLLRTYQEQGIRRLVVLRGDLPSGEGQFSGDFHYAKDLVSFIRKETGQVFEILVAVYPEGHPQAAHLQEDLAHFKEKVDAGADGAITQYFYHLDAYRLLLDDCAKLGITIPIIPGIMPIYQFAQLRRFSTMCGAEIPRYILRRMPLFENDPKATYAFGADIVTRLCEDLLRVGAPGLHFYTLNKHGMITDILNRIL